ncbi:MAG: NADH:ubiquinone reductase (Na(+)-transporting) subunit A, partial [Lentisphaerota bacterium]
FQADIHVAVRGQETAFQAGLNALTRLTEGSVHLCLSPQPDHPSPAVTNARQVSIHQFEGPHPSGNTSVHIFHIDPLKKGDVVWYIKAVDLIQIGECFVTGTVPSHRVVALGGAGVKPAARKYYRVRLGASLAAFLKDKLEPGEQRILGGDALTGVILPPDSSLRFYDSSLTVLPEGRHREFLGWLAPGLNLFSRSKTFLSAWLGRSRTWNLDTNLRGALRPMILTGLYDRYVPLNILVDFLVRAVLAHDTEEAVKLGILDTDPEDFALCSFVCPSKMDLPDIIRRGLEEIEKEGL